MHKYKCRTKTSRTRTLSYTFDSQAAHFTYEFPHILPPHVTLLAKFQAAYPLTADAIDVHFTIQGPGGVDGGFQGGLEGGLEGGRDGGLQK